MTATIEINCEIRARSELAIMIHDGHNTVWVPRSEIVAMNVEEATVGHPRARLYIPLWLAEEKHLIGGGLDNNTADLFGGQA